MSTDLFLAVDANPQDVKAFETLVKTAVSAGDRAILEQVYQRVPEWAPGNSQNHMVRVLSQTARTASDPDLQGWLSYRNGLLLWKTYNDSQMAEMAFRKVETLPEEEGAADYLREFYTEFYVGQGNWRRLEQVLTEPAKGGYDDPILVRRKLAQLAEEKDQADKAIGFWQQVRQADATDTEAEEALARLYRKVGKWNAMVDLLKEQLDRLSAEETYEKILLHREMISIFKEKINAPAKVVSSWQSILEIEPGNSEALDALALEFESMNRWPDLVKVLQQKVEHEQDAAQRVSLHKRIAEIYQQRFNNAGEAIKSYQAILEIEPTNSEAIETLKSIYDARRDYDSFVDISEHELSLVTDEAKRNKALVELARLASEKLRKPQVPIRLWEQVLAGNPEHAEALEALESWFEREKSWENLADVLERRVRLESSVEAQVALLDKLGNIASSRLEDAEKAADVWREILARDPQHRKAQTELRKKYIAERDWEGLEWFFRSYGDAQEWVRTLEQQVKSIEEPEERTELLFKAAAIWRDELKDTRRAVKNLEAVLEVEPRHTAAAGMLIPIYREIQTWKDLPAVYDIVLESTEDLYERRKLLLDLAEVQDGKLDNVEAAFFAYVQAVSENPGDTDLHPQLRSLAERSHNWESYVYVLQDAVDHIELDSARVDVLLEIGHTYRDKLGADESSLTFFYRVLSIDAYNRQALDAAERAWEATGAYDQLVLAYQKRLATVTDSKERLAVLFKLADVWRHNIGANDEAEAVLREMLEDYPSERRVHDSLIEIYITEGRYGELRDVLERKRDVVLAEGASSEWLADLECELGMLAYGTTPANEGVSVAIDHYEAALRYVPLHMETVGRLEELLADEGERSRLTTLLVPVYKAVGDRAKLSQVLEMQQLAAADEDDTVRRIELLAQLATLYRGGGLGLAISDKELAWRTAARRFLLTPSDDGVRAELQQLTTELSRHAELVALYSQEADTPVERDSRLAIKLEVARTWHFSLANVDGHLEQAKDFYQKVRDEAPEHRESIDALEAIFTDLNRPEDLLEIYRGQIELADATERKLEYLFRTSDLLRDRLENYEDAITPAQDALQLVPGNEGAIERLDTLFSVTERWEDLAQTLEDTIRIEGDLERVIRLKNRLASIYEQNLERPETAIEIHASVLEAAQGQPDSVTALERLFERKELAPIVAPILQPHYERENNWRRLVDVYTEREQSSHVVSEKVDWHYRIAALYEEAASQPELAFQHYEEAAQLDPANELTLSELLRLAESLENHGELILFLQSVVEDIPSMDRRVATHRTIAELARDKTRDLEGAEKQFRAILELDSNDMAATDALISLYRETGNSESLVELLLKKANMEAVSQDDRFALHAEAGQIAADTLDNAEQAIEIFEALYQLDPAGETAPDNLEVLFERTEDWDNLVRIYRDKIARADAFEHKKYYAALMGEVQAVKLESPDDAIATWHQVLAWDGRDGDALTQLDALYTQQGDWFNLKETLRKVQANIEAEHGAVSTPEWDEAQFRIAKLYEDQEKLSDLHSAISVYGELLNRNVLHEGAVDALKAVLAEREMHDFAFATLRPVLEARESYEDLWEQYEVLVGHQAEELDHKVESLHQMAELAEIRLGAPERALDAQARAFSIAPHNTKTVGELERLAADYNFWESLVSIYSEQGQEDADEYQGLALRTKAAAILMDRIGDLERATSAYEAIAEAQPEQKDIHARLHSLYEAREMWPELAATLRTQAEVEVEPAQRILFLEKLAQVSETKLDDTQRAYEALTEILDIERTHALAIAELRRLFENGVNPLEISERLEPIYREGARWDELDSLLQLKLTVYEDPADQLQLMRDLAMLALDQRGNQADALEWYGEGFLLDPEDDGLLLDIERLAESTGAWNRYLHFVLEAAERANEDERKIELWHKAGPVARDRAGDLAQAEAIFRKVLDLAPTNRTALRALDELLLAQDRFADLQPILAAQTESEDLFDEERVTVWIRLAELYRDHLGDREAAIHAFNQVLELQDMHEGALHALRVMYTEAERWPELFDVLQRLSDLAREPEERVVYLSDMAQIAEVSLDKADRAIELLEDVLTIRPNDLDAVRELERIIGEQASLAGDAGEREKRFTSLAEAYERELRMDGLDGARRLEVFRTLGRLWQTELDDPFNAQSAWERARGEEALDREALDALRGLHQASGNDQQRAEVLEAAILSEAYSEAEQLSLWRDLAEIRTEVFGDQAGGIEAWTAVLGLAQPGMPEYAEAVTQLEALYEAGQRYQELVDLYSRKLLLLESREKRIEAQLYMGSLEQEQLQRPDLAAATYSIILEEGAAEIPAEGETLRGLRLEASRRLEGIYETAGAWAQLGQLLYDRHERLDREEQLSNLQRLAQIYEQQLNDQVQAFTALQAANQLVPDEPMVLIELERLAEATGLWADLYQTYEDTIPHLDGDAQLDLMLKSAKIQRYQVGDALLSIGLFERVLEHDKENDTALRALIELNESQARYPELIDVMTTLAEVTPDFSEKKGLLQRIAEVYEQQLGEKEAAIVAWDELLALDERDEHVISQLERLHIEQQDWHALIAIYEKDAESSPERELTRRVQIAGIYEGYVQDIDSAIKAYEEVLELDPSHEVTVAKLEEIYQERGEFDSLLEVYERAYNAARSDEDRVRMAANAAMLHSELRGDAKAAAEWLQQLLTLEPRNEEAISNLVTIYTAEKEWDDLIRLYEHRYENAENADERADSQIAMASIYRNELSDPDNAIGMYERVLMERRGDREALQALDELLTAQESWEQVIEVLDKKLEVESDLSERVVLFTRQGEIAKSELGDHYRATGAYTKALAEAPGTPSAVNPLVALYREDEQWDRLIDILKHKLAYTSSRIDAAQVHVDLADVYGLRLNDAHSALHHYEEAERSDPESKRALQELAEHYMRTGDYTRAVTRLDALLEKLDPQRDQELLAYTHKKLGLANEALYIDDQAIDSLTEASRLMVPDLETLQALGRLHFKKGNYREAERYLQDVLDRFKRELSDDDLVQVLMNLGESALKVKNIDKAKTYLHQVVEAQPENTKALESIVEVLRQYGEWDSAVRYQERLLSLKGDDLERYNILLAIGDTYFQQLNNPTRAVEAYRSALKLEVSPKVPAARLFELYLKTGDMRLAVENLNRLISLEEDPVARAKFAFTSGVLHQDHLKEPLEAVKYFNSSLDHNLDRLEAFERIVRILTDAREHEALEKNYRRMLQRVMKEDTAVPRIEALKYQLFVGLGEIYRSRLNQPEKAVDSFKLAKELRPKDAKVREILGELYEVTNELDKSAEEQRWLLSQQPNRYESYHKLVQLFMKSRRYDEAWCVAALLVPMRQATPEETRLYENNKSLEMANASRVIDQALWQQCVMSSMEDVEVGRIFDIIFRGLGKNRQAASSKDYNLKKKARLELNEGLLLTNTIAKVLKLFGQAVPEMYRGETATGIEILPLEAPVMRFGTDVTNGLAERELAFQVARNMVYMQPNHVVTAYYPREALDGLYLGAASVVDPNFPISLSEGVSPEAQQALLQQAGLVRGILDQSLTPELRQQLTAAMRTLWQRSPIPKLGDWHRSIEYTSLHAGLVACNDPGLAFTAVQTDTQGRSRLTRQDKLRDIVLYALSEPYLKLRKALGIQIDYSDLG